jgi:hypothetical protein
VIVRRLLAAALGLLLAAQVVRVAAVRSLPADAAARAWPGHPAARIELGLVAVAEAARQGRPVDPATIHGLIATGAREPLAEAPFLVRGVQAQVAGDGPLAERAFTAARQREGRSLPARYFLADLYLRNGDARRGLPEVAVLARLTPDGPSKLAPYVATFARDRSNWRAVRTMFAREPALEWTSLQVLARDPANADVVLALADPRRRNAASPWLPQLIGSLTEAGQYRKARQIWSDVTGVRVAGGDFVFDSGFANGDPPAPFNWTLTSSTVGLTERQSGQGLHVIFHGQEDGVLASQLLVLPPGRYRLATDAANLPAGATSLSWALVCDKGSGAIASTPLDVAVRDGFRFAVPASCGGQRLQLVGSAAEMARQVDLTIRGINLQREGAGG